MTSADISEARGGRGPSCRPRYLPSGPSCRVRSDRARDPGGPVATARVAACGRSTVIATQSLCELSSSDDRRGCRMASITIRNLDDDVKTRLRVRAAEEEARLILRDVVGRKPSSGGISPASSARTSGRPTAWTWSCRRGSPVASRRPSTRGPRTGRRGSSGRGPAGWSTSACCRRVDVVGRGWLEGFQIRLGSERRRICSRIVDSTSFPGRAENRQRLRRRRRSSSSSSRRPSSAKRRDDGAPQRKPAGVQDEGGLGETTASELEGGQHLSVRRATICSAWRRTGIRPCRGGIGRGCSPTARIGRPATATWSRGLSPEALSRRRRRGNCPRTGKLVRCRGK